MEQKEFNEMMDKNKESIISEAKSAVSGDITEVKEAVKAIEVKADEIDRRAKAIEASVAEQAKFSKPIVNEKSMESVFTKNADNLKSLKTGESKNWINLDIKAFETKAAANITLSNWTNGTYNLTQLDTEFADLPRRSPFLRDLVRKFPVTSKYVTWVEKSARNGTAGNTAEGAAKTLVDFTYTEATKQVEKITAYMKATKESLDDIPRLMSDIRSEIVDDIALKLDVDLYSGSGTTPVIKGITGYAPTFSVTGTPFITTGGGVKSANRFDVIRVGAWIVNNNYFQANAVCVNSVDAAQMDLIKDANGQYVLPPFQTSNGQQIAGLRVVVNNGVTAGDFLIGDFSKSNLGIREDISLSVGYDQDDFTKNFVTILGEARVVHYIKANHVNAFVKGTFSTAITAMSV